jgi:transcriptional regulator with XRE-family HTH domain
VHGLHRAIAMLLTKTNQSLSGSQFRFLRKELELSQEMLGKLLGYTDGQQIAKWEKGARLPKLIDGTIRKLYLESIDEKNIAFNVILKKLQEFDSDHHNAKLIFSDTPKKGWVARAA